jgi:hypothetical protein
MIRNRPALLASLLLAVAACALTACSDDAAQLPPCEDGTDNDGDTFVDAEDPSCALGFDDESMDPFTDCNDDEDDDGDDLIDWPDDPGCEDITDDSELDSGTAECNDGVDNDRDGLTDYPDDPGCFSSLQDDESDQCPDGAACPQCADGQDNDGDGDSDYPADDGCDAASDDQELTEDPTACAGVTFTDLPADGYVSAVLQAGTNQLSSATCGGTGPELVYQFYVADPQVMVATTALSGTFTDTVLYVRERCMETATEVGCNDDADVDTNSSTLNVALEPGYYFLVVDGRDAAQVGSFQMQVDFYPGFGSECDPSDPDPCAPGLVCRVVPPATEPTCEEPVCTDNRDDDGDGLTDFPADPGCSSEEDSTEDDDCPDGLDCPDCSDGDDNDLDGLTDYPADTDCASAGQIVEGCGVEDDAIATVTSDTHTGSNVGGNHDFTPSCGFSGTAPDDVWLFALPQPVSSLVIDTLGSGYDTILSLLPGNCAGASIACDDNSAGGGAARITQSNVAAGVYAIVVDGYNSGAGAYQLHVEAEAHPGDACTDPMFAAGILSCPTWAPCDGSICVPPDCSDGVDDDGDGLVDFPDDPGCAAVSGASEVDDCPSGPNCPDCSDDADNDGDGVTDYPLDTDCSSASQIIEGCGQEQDPIQTVTAQGHTGTTTGMSMDFTGSCTTGTTSSPDVVYLFQMPVPASSIVIDTFGSVFDTVLYVKGSDCGGPDLACNDQFGGDQSQVTLGAQPAGLFTIIVDGWFGTAGNYVLNINATALPGAACTHPLFAAGVMDCPSWAPCNGTICQGPECSNGTDDDGDGLTDFPADPGCTDAMDATETDDCPSGPNCPDCSDDADNDGDGLTDYPTDANCLSAADTTEGCESDPTTTISMPLTTGSTVGLSDFFEPACGFNSGADKTFLLEVPVTLSTLTVDTVGSAFDTILSLKSAGCELTDLACDDNSGGVGGSSRMIRNNVAAGDYVFVVDGYNNAQGNYALNVRGFAAPGSACTDPLFASGVLFCAVGQSCVSGTCQ